MADEFQGTSSSQMTIIKDLGAPVGQWRTNARESFNDAIAPEWVSPNCIVYNVYSEQIVYDIPVDWLATLYAETWTENKDLWIL